MYISQVYGGPELRGSKIDRAIARLTELRGPGQEGTFGSLDIVFHVPGSVAVPEHSGIRTGRFSKKERMLMLQIAVAKEVLDKDATEINAYLLACLREAIRMATPIFRRAEIPYREDEYLSLIERIETSLIH